MRSLTRSMCLAPSRRRQDEAPRRDRRGFSIIEAIVAMMLLSFGVLALASSAAMTIREMRASSQRVSDAALAATSFERLRSFEKCGVITTKAASISGMTATTVAIPGAPRIINLRYVLPVQAGVRKTSQEYRSSVPCVL